MHPSTPSKATESWLPETVNTAFRDSIIVLAGSKEASWEQTLIRQHDSPGPPMQSRGLHTNCLVHPQCWPLLPWGIDPFWETEETAALHFQSCRGKCLDQREREWAKEIPLASPLRLCPNCQVRVLGIPPPLAAGGPFLGPERIKLWERSLKKVPLLTGSWSFFWSPKSRMRNFRWTWLFTWCLFSAPPPFTLLSIHPRTSPLRPVCVIHHLYPQAILWCRSLRLLAWLNPQPCPSKGGSGWRKAALSCLTAIASAPFPANVSHCKLMIPKRQIWS